MKLCLVRKCVKFVYSCLGMVVVGWIRISVCGGVFGDYSVLCSM